MSGRDYKPIPAFGTKILIKRRVWQRRDLEPTHESAWYLSPDPDGHGHRVLRDDRVEIAPYYIMKVTEPVNEETWLAVLAEQDKDAEAHETEGKDGHSGLGNLLS